MTDNAIEITVSAEQTVSRELDDIADSAVDSSNTIQRAMGSSEEAFDTAARASGRMGEHLDMMSGATGQLSGGLGDVGGALTEAFGEESMVGQFGAQMEKASAIVTGFTGIADLAMLANTALSGSFIKNAAAQVGSKVATVASTVATGVATAAQWAWNAAMTANPIGLIIAAVVALVAIIVLIATKTTWFQDLWNVVWGAIKVAFEATFNFIKSYYEFVFNALITALTTVRDFFVAAFRWAIDMVVNYFQFIYSIPGKVVNVFQSIGSAIFAPFKWAFNAIANAWNNTVGSLSFSIPDWVPGIGGAGFSMPHLPTLATGGTIQRTGMVLAHKGEEIQPASAAGLVGGNKGPITLVINFTGAEGEFRRWLKSNTRLYGGGGNDSVQIAWGS